MTNEIKKNLRRFVITPLLNAIDMGDNIDSLIEIRNVVILFANFITPRSDSRKLLIITDKIYRKLSSVVSTYEGILNKVLLFDKDMMFLSIFGLRGLQHENDAEIALRCAYELRETFKQWSEISRVSIGVTSGKTYCGVIGHTLRREYSVISVAVNRAARLMMAYPNVVSCDQDTLIQSKINLKNFRPLPKRTLKGIRSYRRIYEFQDIFDFDKISLGDNKAEIIYGRDETFVAVEKIIGSAIETFNGNRQNGNKNNNSCICVIKGESQQGKTKVINKLYRDYHESGLKCLRLSLNTKHSSLSFFIIQYLSTRIFETENFEEIVNQKLSHLKIDEYFFVLNEIFNTSYEQVEEFKELPRDLVINLQQLLITTMFKQSDCFWIVMIDDADFIDSNSLNFLKAITSSQTIFFILTIGKQQKRWTLQQKKFYKDDTLLHCLNLRPIDKTFQKDIACQSINVSAMPVEFERFLHKNSNGCPGWIETCTKTLLYSGKLKIKSVTVKESILSGMILKNDLMIHISLSDGLYGFFDIIHTATTLLHQSDGLIDVAIIQDGKGLLEQDYVVSHANSKLILYDSLSSHDQMVCKCASVLGPEFHRGMLNYLLCNSNMRVVGKTIVKLFQLNILYCALAREKYDDAMWAIKNEVILCNCDIDIIESCRDLPKYASCLHLTFHDENFRKYIYDTLTEKQRVSNSNELVRGLEVCMFKIGRFIVNQI